MDPALPRSVTQAEPRAVALLLDVDGVLAPIVEDPAAAAVPEPTLSLLAQLQVRLGLLAFVTGRAVEDASRMIPLERVWIAAAHGMCMRAPDGSERIDPAAQAARTQLDLAVQLARTVGWRYEDKGQSVTVHFRHVDSPELTARGMRAQMSTVLDPRLVQLHDARMALEVRPAGSRTKGDAVRDLLGAVTGIEHALYVGDDRTDIDAFAALADAAPHPVRVAVASDESPAELLAQADVVLEGQQDVDALLRSLA